MRWQILPYSMARSARLAPRLCPTSEVPETARPSAKLKVRPISCMQILCAANMLTPRL